MSKPQTEDVIGKPTEEQLALGTDPIPAKPYYCPEYFALEKEAIFKRCWLQVGHMCELPEPGSFIVRSIDLCDVSILITHGKDGKIRAFHNVCTHRGTQLVAKSEGKANTFTCPYHAWTFNNDGGLRAAPDFDRFYVEKSDCGLPEIALDVVGKLIFVNLDPLPKQSLREFLGPLVDQLEKLPSAKATHFSEYTYDIDANWKLAYDNFQENYHLRFIHPRSGEASSGPDNPFGYPIRYGFHDPHRTQTIWSNPGFRPQPIQGYTMGKLMDIILASGSFNPETAREYYALYPNFFVLGSPGTPFSHSIIPVSEKKSRGVIRLYWIGEDQSATERYAREYMTATTLDVHSEDRGVIEAGQRGLQSGAIKYIHFQSQEVLCRHLFIQVDNAVKAYQAELKGSLV